MERVKKDERYWYIFTDEEGGIDTSFTFDDYTDLHDNRNWGGNYFHTKEEAETMAEKIRAVLKGADVIEIPSDDEMYDAIADEFYDNPYTTEKEEHAFQRGVEWLKSKIVK